MKGDFSRKTFNKKKHYSSVRMQQGRVQLDADWNEQMDIWAHRIQTETQDFIGISGTPDSENEDGGFKIVANGANLEITSGRYYVNGLLCENEAPELLTKQSDCPGLELPNEAGKYLIYLDVWQHHITGIEDPEIEEPALKGADTTTRVKNLAQVKWAPLTNDAGNIVDVVEKWKTLKAPSNGKLEVKVSDEATLQDQLYQVEIHKGGSLEEATFKWSRDNGSTAVNIEQIDGDSIIVKDFKQDEHRKFEIGDWLELNITEADLRGEPGIFVRIEGVEGNSLLLNWFNDTTYKEQFSQDKVVGIARRWDTHTDHLINRNNYTDINPSLVSRIVEDDNLITLQISWTEEINTDGWLAGQFIELLDNKGKSRFAQIIKISDHSVILTDLPDFDIKSLRKFRLVGAGALPVNKNDFIHLEDGLQIRFSGDEFKSGDFWKVSTRTTSDAVNWSEEAQLSHGTMHYYALLAEAEYNEREGSDELIWENIQDRRTIFSPISSFKHLNAIKAEPNSPPEVIEIKNTGDVLLHKNLKILGNLDISEGKVTHHSEANYTNATFGETEENQITFKGEIKTGRSSGFVKMTAPLRISIGASANKKMPHLSLENPETRKDWRIYNGFKSDDVLSLHNNAKKKPCLAIDTSGNLKVAGTVTGRDLEEDGKTVDNIKEIPESQWLYLSRLDQNLDKSALPSFAGLKVSNKVHVTSEGNIGIGTNSPKATLHIEDAGTGKQKSFMIGDKVYFTALEAQNSIGIYGIKGISNYAAIKLGLNGPMVSGFSRRVYDKLTKKHKLEGRFRVEILQLADKWTLSGVGDHNATDQTWLRLLDVADRESYSGGFAAKNLWCRTFTKESDIRQKENIKPLTQALDKLLSLRGVSFDWKESKMDSKQQIGLIAQEVEPVFPELINSMSQDSDRVLGINYIGLIPVLIESIKELQQQFKKLSDSLNNKEANV